MVSLSQFYSRATSGKKILDLLLGKSLTCTYELGQFNTDWVNTISIGLDYCEGGLVDSMNIIIVAVS